MKTSRDSKRKTITQIDCQIVNVSLVKPRHMKVERKRY